MLTKIAKAARTMPGIAALVAATALGGVGTAYALAGNEDAVTIKQESFEPTPTPPPATVEPTVAPEPVVSEVPAPVPEEPTVSPKPAPKPVPKRDARVIADDDPIRLIAPPPIMGNMPPAAGEGAIFDEASDTK